MSIANSVLVWYSVIAIAASLFNGVFAIAIFEVKTEHKRWHFFVAQVWLNFVGSIVGWVALWFLGRSVAGWLAENGSPQFTWSDLGLFLLAFWGVTGYLPYTLVGLASGAHNIAGRFLGSSS